MKAVEKTATNVFNADRKLDSLIKRRSVAISFQLASSAVQNTAVQIMSGAPLLGKIEDS